MVSSSVSCQSCDHDQSTRRRVPRTKFFNNAFCVRGCVKELRIRYDPIVMQYACAKGNHGTSGFNVSLQALADISYSHKIVAVPEACSQSKRL
eukprot:scaffold250627_cov46-Attheya_sp.AAC.1